MTELPTPSGGHTAYGVTVYEIGEDGDTIVAFGHHDPRRFLAACQHYVRTEWDWVNLADDRTATFAEMRAEIGQDHATFEPVPDPDEYPDGGWVITWDQPAGPTTVPITIWRG